MEKTILIKNARAIVTCDGQDRVCFGADMLIRGPEIVKIGNFLPYGLRKAKLGENT